MFRLISAYLDYIITNICCHFKNRKVYLQVDFTTLSCVQKKASARKLPAEAFSIILNYAAPTFFFAFSSFSKRSFSSCSSRHFWCEYFKPEHEMFDAEEQDPDEGPDEMFRFIKVMKP